MKLTKYPQSCFLIELENARILIDPGKYCYYENFKAGDWKDIDILLLTHGHKDHCLPEAVETIYKNNKLMVLGSKWTKEKMDKKVLVEVFKPNEEKKIDKIIIKAVKTLHGEHPNMSKSPRETIGFLIENNQSVYHCSDTLYMKDKPYADIVLVPISNDWITMGPKEAAIFVKDIKPKLAIPMHYDSPDHPMDPEEFIKEMQGSNIEVKILKNKETIEI